MHLVYLKTVSKIEERTEIKKRGECFSKMLLLNEINSRIKLASILIVIAYFVIVSSKRVKLPVQHGPRMHHNESTNCSEFAKYGRFNPYSVIHAKWFVFYYWAPIRPLTTYIFTAPSSNHTRKLKKLFEGNCVLPVQWHVRHLLMEDNNKFISLLVERSDRGEYWQYPVARVRKGQKITPRDIRLKQTGDNRLLGLFDCVADTLIVMSRLNDVPTKGKLHEEASRLGYRGTKGKSYLYQGHEWGPIEEADENDYWERSNEKTISKDTSTEDKSSEGSSEEAEQSKNEPEHSKAKKLKPKKSTVLPPVVPEDDETCVKVMPELWNDPKPNPNPDNLLTKEDLNNLNSFIINENLVIEGPVASADNKQESYLAIEGPDAPTDNKQEGNVDKESENLPENDEVHNYNDAYKLEIPDSTDNKKESNIDKESENLPKNKKLHNHNDAHKMEILESADNKKESSTDKESENTPDIRKLHNHKDVHKMETPDSTDNKPESNTDKESENSLENKKLYNHNDAHKMEIPESADNKKEINTVKESKNPPENRKLHNHKDVHKMETPDLTDNEQESNINEVSKNPHKNDNPHNYKVCPETSEPDDDNENCVVCYKSKLNYVSDDIYIPDSTRSIPDLKENEDTPPKEVPQVDVPRFKIGGIELLLEEQPRTEVPIPKVPSAKTPRTEVPTQKVPSSKTPRTEVPTSKVPSDKTPRTKAPGAKVPARSPAPPPQDQTNSSEIIYLTPRTLDDLESRINQ